jgi:antitoxin component HigA of HigAB toxin-antitoxin module
MNQAYMGRIFGSESGVSMFLKGERGLSKARIKKLPERFKVEAGVFME